MRRHQAAQTICREMERVLCVRALGDLALEEGLVGGFGAVRVLETGDCRVVARIKAMAAREASAPCVAFIEEHAFPSSEWAQRLAEAMEGGCAAAGPVMVNANPQLAASWANFVIEYGPWEGREQRRHPEHLPGNNGGYRRAALLEMGEGLEAMLDAESLLHWELRRRGHPLVQEPEARVVHLNITRFGSFWPVHFHYSRMFAAARAKRWTPGKRLVYAAGGFLIPLIRLRRHWPDIRRVTPTGKRGVSFWGWLALGLGAAGLGEVAGYLAGRGNSREKIYWLEFHRPRHLSDADPARDEYAS